VKYKTLFRIICKAIGVYFIVIGGSGFVGGVTSAVAQMIQFAKMGPQFSQSLWPFAYVLGPLMQLAAGLYLFFDGRRVVDMAVPGNRPYCPECGYDLTAASTATCPECGTEHQIAHTG
jgi:hypothetical protein